MHNKRKGDNFNVISGNTSDTIMQSIHRKKWQLSIWFLLMSWTLLKIAQKWNSPHFSNENVWATTLAREYFWNSIRWLKKNLQKELLFLKYPYYPKPSIN